MGDDELPIIEHSIPVEEHGRALHTLDQIASRLRAYFIAIATVGVVVGTATSWIVFASTEKVRDEVEHVKVLVVARAYSDSVRFERVIEIVELSVVALVEKPGSAEQLAALAALRSHRRYAR
jgi:hypothetical protein